MALRLALFLLVLAAAPSGAAFDPKHCIDAEKGLALSIGGEVGVRGKNGHVHVVGGPGIPADSVIKIYEPDGYRGPFTRAEVDGFARRYQAVHDLLPHWCVQPHGVREVEPGVYGLVMERIPDRIRLYNPAWVNERTIRDLVGVRDALLAAKLTIADIQFTTREDGSVILYDLDGVSSWDPAHPFYSAQASREYFIKRIDGWITMIRRDMAARR